VAVLSGFGTDTFNHLSKYGLDYPLIVHFHAVAFVGYLTLFTVQVALIRQSNLESTVVASDRSLRNVSRKVDSVGRHMAPEIRSLCNTGVYG
jgi:hypothetical protein